MKILSIGDSLSLPGHTNLYEDTWFYKLKKAYPNDDFISFFKRRLTTDVLNTMGGGEPETGVPMGADCLEHYRPKIVILQLGIVDCAPRLINNTSLTWKIVRRMPNFIINKYVNYLKTKNRNPHNVIVSPKTFEANMDNYLKRCQAINLEKLIYIAIPIPGKEMTSKNSGVLNNIQVYNNILERLKTNYPFMTIIYPLDISNDKTIYHDGYHPNSHGNLIVFNELSNQFC